MLVHLSFNEHLEGIWLPRYPAQSKPAKKSQFPIKEKHFKRVCVAPSIEKAFFAIYPNISKFFEIDQFPYMNMAVYAPQLTGAEDIIGWEQLTKRRWVPDAHVTHETAICSPVMMKLVDRIRIHNTATLPEDHHHYFRPFDDENAKWMYLAPPCQYESVSALK